MKFRLILIAIAAVAVVGASVVLVYAWESPTAPVAVEPDTGRVHVKRMVAAIDAGQVVNPDGIRNQVEGGMLQALSWALFERMTFDRTRVTSIDWSAYPILHFGVVPGSIVVHIIERPGDSFFGVAEAAQGPSGAALANAIRDATGLRLRELPFTASKIKSAIGL
jgi:nicotinate dehydrogenase subunit B